ncbi:MAG: hypothetical protein WD872_05445 [Pirellulaceae bacterium]
MDRFFPPQPAETLPPTPPAHGWLLLGLLAGVVLLQDIVWLVVLRTNRADWPSPLAIAAMGLAFAQAGLIPLLILWGTGRLWMRCATALPLYLFAAWLATRGTDGNLRRWLSITLFYLAIVAAPLVIARLAGVRMVRVGDAEAQAGSRQFTIFGLLTLTTVVAVVCGVARWLSFPWEEIGAVATFAIALAGIPWLCATVALAPVASFWSPVAVALVCPLAGWLISLTGFPPRQPVELIAMCCVQGLLTVGACAVARLAGYRLIGPGRS